MSNRLHPVALISVLISGAAAFAAAPPAAKLTMAQARAMALRLARTKKQGSRLLFEQQVVQLKLNRMHLLTEALRSFVMRVAWEHDHKMHSANPGLCMNFSTDVIQEVSELNLELHADAGVMDARADKLVRDAIIWSHLAGDSVQRMKTTRRLAK